MKKRTVSMISFCFFSFWYFFSVSFACVALTRNDEWLAVCCLMLSLYVLLLLNSVLRDFKYEPEKKTKQEETENREGTRDSESVEKSDSTNAEKSKGSHR